VEITVHEDGEITELIGDDEDKVEDIGEGSEH